MLNKILLVSLLTVTFPAGMVIAQTHNSMMNQNPCNDSSVYANDGQMMKEYQSGTCGECTTSSGLPGVILQGKCHRC